MVNDIKRGYQRTVFNNNLLNDCDDPNLWSNYLPCSTASKVTNEALILPI